MNIEQEIFSSYKSSKEKLIKYGFISFDDVFTYSKEIVAFISNSRDMVKK